jgi:hypothetical protein
MREPAVADLMARQVIAVVPDTPLALPVIDLVGHPIGVVIGVDALTKLECHGGADYLPLLAGAGCRALGYLTRPYIVYRSRDTQLGSRAPRRGWERVR